MTTDSRGERLDLKKLWTQFLHRLWIIIAATAVGAIIGVLAYVIYSNVMNGNTVYQIRNDYYIYMNYDEYPNGPDYYNAYTWDSILRDDPVVNYAIEINPSLAKEDILTSVTGEILGDYRILTVVVKGTNQELIQSISDTYKTALPHFAEQIDMIDSIEVWTDAAMEEYDEYTREPNAAFLGGFIAFLISLFVVIFACALDDRIYTEKDWRGRYPEIPYLGKLGTDEYAVNKAYLIDGDSEEANVDSRIENYPMLAISDFEFSIEAFKKLRQSGGVVLRVAMGKDKAETIDKVVYTLIKQDIHVKAVEMY